MASATVSAKVRIVNDHGLLKAAARLRSRADELTDEIADEVLTTAKILCPVRSGALRASGRKSRQGHTVTITFGNEAVRYAVYVEQGTRYMRAQPFLLPAVEQARGNMLAKRLKVI